MLHVPLYSLPQLPPSRLKQEFIANGTTRSQLTHGNYMFTVYMGKSKFSSQLLSVETQFLSSPLLLPPQFLHFMPERVLLRLHSLDPSNIKWGLQKEVPTSWSNLQARNHYPRSEATGNMEVEDKMFSYGLLWQCSFQEHISMLKCSCHCLGQGYNRKHWRTAVYKHWKQAPGNFKLTYSCF